MGIRRACPRRKQLPLRLQEEPSYGLRKRRIPNLQGTLTQHVRKLRSHSRSIVDSEGGSLGAGSVAAPPAARHLVPVFWILLTQLYLRVQVREHRQSPLRGWRRRLFHQQLVPQKTKPGAYAPGWRGRDKWPSTLAPRPTSRSPLNV